MKLIRSKLTFRTAATLCFALSAPISMAQALAWQGQFGHHRGHHRRRLGAAPVGVAGLKRRFAPRGTHEPVLAGLKKACADTTTSDGFRTSAARLHQRVAYLGRRDIDRRLRNDHDEKAKLIGSLNLQPE